jgi:hypothetical protein
MNVQNNFYTPSISPDVTPAHVFKSLNGTINSNYSLENGTQISQKKLQKKSENFFFKVPKTKNKKRNISMNS